MRPWQSEALKLFREARAHATRTSNTSLHLQCCRAIEAMIAEGGCVPSDLRIYARQTRLIYGAPDAHAGEAVSSGCAG
jgi:hypothetical protein